MSSGLPEQRAQFPGDASRIVAAVNDVDPPLSTSQHIDRVREAWKWGQDALLEGDGIAVANANGIFVASLDALEKALQEETP